MSGGDVSSTLTELERKLRELEQELSTLGGEPAGPEPAPAAAGRPPFAPPSPSPAGAPALGLLGDAQRRIDDLQGQLEELLAFRDELAEAAAALVAEYTQALGQLAGHERELEGDVTIDAGPFADIATLAAFERELAAVDGAEQVRVRSFADGRAQVDVRLGRPVALLRELKGRPFAVDEAEADRVKLTFEG